MFGNTFIKIYRIESPVLKGEVAYTKPPDKVLFTLFPPVAIKKIE